MKNFPDISRYKFWLLLLFGTVLIATSGNWGVVETSEARYAEISREMLVSHDWVHPTLMGIYHYHKPPLTYWITSAGFSIFGINPFGARFFLQVSALIQLIVLYRIAKQMVAEQSVAFLACIIYGSMSLVLVSVRGLTTDSYLNTFVLVSILAWLSWRSQGKPAWLYVLALAFAFGFLTKGPLIFIVPSIFIAGFINVMHARTMTIHHLLAFLVFIVVGLSWYGILAFENKEFVDYFLHRQTYERLVHADVFSRAKPFWYYIAFLPLLLLPWSGIFLGSLFEKQEPIIRRLNIFWVALPLLFFSLASSKLVLYVLPVCGGISISVAYAIHTYKHRYQEWFVIGVFLLQWATLLLAKWIDQSSIYGTALVGVSAISIILILGIRTISQIAVVDRVGMYAIVSTIFLLIFTSIFMGDNELLVNSTAPISRWLRHNSFDHKKVIIYNSLLPSIEFQSGKEVWTINAGDKYLQREVNFQRDHQWRKHLLNLQDPVDVDSIRKILQMPSIVIVKGHFQKGDEWIGDYFENQQHVDGKWTIYH